MGVELLGLDDYVQFFTCLVIHLAPQLFLALFVLQKCISQLRNLVFQYGNVLLVPLPKLPTAFL